MAIATARTVVLDAPDPVALAGFYAQIIGGEVKDNGEGWVDLEGASETLLSFQAAPGLVPPAWPSAEHSQQFHLDFTVADLDAAEKEVLRIGAVALDAEDRERSFRVYRDPAGHPFCLCAC
ncbi:VOC family protein [Streptomyces sp. NBC_01497]|uniref:VOC family protein n=1 Tax=Streptomyces sp. NBC_01497 TaxID=2903885 RepID=UPI002E2F4802|nr:VOC family protein [Streptomyces sp. NBC_01497]